MINRFEVPDNLPMPTTKKTCLLTARLTASSALALCMLAAPARAAGCAKQTRLIEGDLAAELAYVLRELPNSSKRLGRSSMLISLEAMQCQRLTRELFPDQLPVFRCGEPPAVDGLTAKLLWDSLAQLNVYADSGMGRAEMQASNIRCTIEQQSSDPRHSPRCSVTAVWKDLCD